MGFVDWFPTKVKETNGCIYETTPNPLKQNSQIKYHYVVQKTGNFRHASGQSLDLEKQLCAI